MWNIQRESPGKIWEKVADKCKNYWPSLNEEKYKGQVNLQKGTIQELGQNKRKTNKAQVKSDNIK